MGETEVNQMVFEQAKRTASTIQKTFGKNCEIAIHNFRNFQNLNSTLIYIAGNLTNRKIGSPPTDLVLKELKRDPKDIRDIPEYLTESKNGLLMKSATVFLRGINDEVIGALCLNFNISEITQLSYELQDFINIEENDQSEAFFDNVHEVIEEMVRQVIREFNKPTGLLTKEEKVEIVSILDGKGAFLIKGSTEYLADVLNVSKFTIYNYLQSVRAKKEYSERGVGKNSTVKEGLYADN